VYCDVDDRVAPGWLAAMAAALDRAALVAGTIDFAPLTPRPLVAALRAGGTGNWLARSWLPVAVGCTMGVQREAFDAVGGFRAELGSAEDRDFSWRVQLAGFRLEVATDAVVHRHVDPVPRQLWRRRLTYGRWDPVLYRLFRSHGMPRSSLRDALYDYAWITIGIVRLGDASFRYRWLLTAGLRAGRIRGSVACRTLYL
jgi:GT2 family glycosyltransferase